VVEINIDLAMPAFLWSGKTPVGREAVEQVNAESPIESRKILEARGWTVLRQLTTEVDDSPTESPQFQQGTVPGFWSGWFAELRRSPGFFILMVIFLIVAIHQERTQLERTSPGSEIWICWVSFMLAVGVFAYPVSYWRERRRKRRIVEQEEAKKAKAKE
jgi:hypothetical protein